MGGGGEEGIYGVPYRVMAGGRRESMGCPIGQGGGRNLWCAPKDYGKGNLWGAL